MIDPGSERRVLRRSLRHLACEVEVEGVSTKAVILNLSARGVFVRTNAKASIGAPAIVRIRRPGGVVWELETEVARLRDRDQAPASTRGLGLEILLAPPGFEEFVAEVARER
jgi:hypothetical protein